MDESQQINVDEETASYDHPLAEYDDDPLLILTGSAGAGKTYELEELHKSLLSAKYAVNRVRMCEMRDGYMLVERGLNDTLNQALNSKQKTYLLIDALDESIHPQILDRLSEHLQSLSPEDRSHLRIRATSRSSYFATSLALQEDIQRISTTMEGHRVLELAPLNDEQIKRAAELCSVDSPDAFIGKVHEKKLRDLAATPSTLDLLLGLYLQSGDFPPTRSEVFEQGIVLRLDAEVNRPNALEWSLERIMDAMGATAALLLLSSNTFVQASAGQSTAPDVSLPLHEARKLAPFDTASMKETTRFFQSPLFDGGHGEDALGGYVEIGSRNFAEFLAGRYLSRTSEQQNHSPSTQDLLALLSVGEDPRRGVRPDLFEVAGWIAALAPEGIFDHLLGTDPDVILLGDPSMLSGEKKAVLISVLTDWVSERRLNAYELGRAGLGGLSHPGLTDQVEVLLGSEADSPQVLFGLELYSANELVKLTPLVVQIATDRNYPVHVRRLALLALEEAPCSDEQLAELKPLLSDNNGDPFYSLRAPASRVLFPPVMSGREFMQALSLPTTGDLSSRDIDNSFGYFLEYELPPKLDRDGISAAFENIAELIQDEAAAHLVDRKLGDFAGALLSRAAHMSGLLTEEAEQVVIPGFRDQVLAWMRRSVHGGSDKFYQLWRSSSALRAYGLALVSEEADGYWGNLFWKDLNRLVKAVGSAEGLAKHNYMVMLWRRTQNLEGIPVRLGLLSDPEFVAFAAERRNLSPGATAEEVGRDLEQQADTWREWDAEKEQKSSDENSGSDEDAEWSPERIVSKAEAWPEIWSQLHAPERYRSGSDWTAFPSWNDLSEGCQEKAVGLAEQYVEAVGAEWQGKWRKASQGSLNEPLYAALRLLSEQGHLAEKTAWLPTFVSLALERSPGQDRWAEFALDAWQLDPLSARRSAMHVTSRLTSTGTITRASLALFAQHDGLLARALSEIICREDLSAEFTAEIARVLLASGHDSTMESLSAVLSRSADRRRVAAVAVAILSSGNDLAPLWERLETDQAAADTLITSLEGLWYAHTRVKLNVDPGQRCMLMGLAVSYASRAFKPQRPLYGSYTPTTIDDVESWIGQQATVLVDGGHYEALEVFVAEHPRYAYLPHRAWISWRRQVSAAYRYTVRDLVKQLNNLELRPIGSAMELLCVVLESLTRYQDWLDEGAVYDIWHDVRPTLLGLPAKKDGKKLHNVLIPYREEPASDHLARFMARDLKQVIIRREVRTTKRGRTDVEVTAIDADGNEVQTIVEVKGSYHKDATEIQSQLVDRYLGDPEVTGVFLVFDFWTESWSKLDRTARRHGKKTTGQVLVAALEQAHQAISEKGRVAWRIVQASYPG